MKKLLTKCKIAKFFYRMTIKKYKVYKRNKLFLNHGLDALYAMDDAFCELGIMYWLEFGTLLGAVREKGFIEHDLDIDLACFFADYSEENEKVFQKHGFVKTRGFLIDDGKFGREETYTYKGVDIDIFYFHLRDDEMYCHLFAPRPGAGWNETVKKDGDFLVRELRYPYAGFEPLEFFDRTFNVPSNLKEHLSASYGENYMVKDPNYSNSIATNVRILDDKVGKGFLNV